MDILSRAAQFRGELLRQERRAAAEMVAYYSDAWQRIRGDIEDLLARMEQARSQGQQISLSWLAQLDRMQRLERQIQAEIAGFARFAEQSIVGLQAQAVEAGQAQAEQLTLLGLKEPEAAVSLSRLPSDAVTDLVGFLQDGSPLRTLLDELPAGAPQIVRKALVSAVALGISPKLVARQIKGELGGNLVRALTISRTEMMRSYRSASLRTYQANSTVVQGWVWTAQMSSRTCAACIALHGTEHELEEAFGSHPRCRCSPIPWLRREELNPQVERGEEWFAKQDPKTQLAVLGPAKFEAYRAGEIKLSDLVGFERNPKWGPQRWEKSLKEALGEAEARKWRVLAKQGGSQPVPPSPKPKSASPAGSQPVGAALAVKATGVRRAAAERAIQAIDAIHADGALPLIPIRNSAATDCNGFFEVTKKGRPVKIGLTKIGTTPALTCAHEIGHFLDHAGIDPLHPVASWNSPLMQEWRQAAYQSAALKRIQDLIAANGIIQLPTGQMMAFGVQHLLYLSEPHEVWARSYAQWIARRSQDSQMLAELDSVRQSLEGQVTKRQWDDGDFGPIDAAIEKLIKQLGWMP